MNTVTRLLARFSAGDLGLAGAPELQAAVQDVVDSTNSYDAALLELLERRHARMLSQVSELEIVGEYRERRELTAQIGGVERQIRQLRRALFPDSTVNRVRSVIASPELG